MSFHGYLMFPSTVVFAGGFPAWRAPQAPLLPERKAASALTPAPRRPGRPQDARYFALEATSRPNHDSIREIRQRLPIILGLALPCSPSSPGHILERLSGMSEYCTLQGAVASNSAKLAVKSPTCRRYVDGANLCRSNTSSHRLRRC